MAHDYKRALAAEAGTVRRVPGCAGLRLPVDKLWAEIDRLAPPDPAII